MLHCVSNYPCSDESLNLNNIKSLNKKFNLIIGFSDHSQNSNSSLIAIGLGARIIERHINGIRNSKDQIIFHLIIQMSLKNMLTRLEMQKKFLVLTKKIKKEEVEMKKISRKGIYYISDIPSVKSQIKIFNYCVHL